MSKEIKNIAASVHTKLLNLAKKRKRPFNELLQFYGLERFLYRLSVSKYKDQYVLKGALMFLHWTGERSRPTRDIDLLRDKALPVEEIAKAFREICTIPVDQDGVHFSAETVEAKSIIPEEGSRGVRLNFLGYLGSSVIPMRIDVAFGDVVVPGIESLTLNTLLDFPRPVLRGYSIETAIAEKLHAIVKLGLVNSRLKDYYDIWYILTYLSPNSNHIIEAIIKTFQRRKTTIPSSIPEGLTEKYASRHKKNWEGMLKRNRLVGPDLASVVQEMEEKFKVILQRAQKQKNTHD